MFGFISSALGWLQSIGKYLIDLLLMLRAEVLAVVQIVALPVTIRGYLPAILSISVAVVIAIMVTKLIVGR